MNTKDVADFILDTNFDKLPPEVITKAKLCVLDALGGAIAAHNTKSVGIMRGLICSMGGKEEATLFGLGLKAPLAGAALVNGIMSTVLDTDDGCFSSVGHLGHIGGCVIPAALAVGEREGSTGVEFLEAVVVGYETALRKGWMLREPEPKKPPLTGGIGAYGAAVAAAKLLKLTRGKIINTLGICEAHLPMPKLGGVALPGPATAAMTKESMHWATMTGVMAALLAQGGFTGPSSIYDNPNYDPSPLDTLGKEYLTMNVYFKPYCACRQIHSTLDIILEMVKKQALNPGDVVGITVEVGKAASRFYNPRPVTVEQSEFSIPFLVGAALVDGKVGPEQVRESRLSDKAILKQADKVKVVFSEAVEALYPQKCGAIITVETKDGKKHKMQRDIPRGEPEDPLSHKEIKGKFREWATTVMDKDRAEEVLACTNNLESLDNIGKLVDLLASF